jgi:TRAP-type C4-dicarboxylate transport system permease small subunit
MRMDAVRPPSERKRGLLFYAGAAGLLGVMLVETAAVIGRHVGAPLTGALELVQAAIVPAACASILMATLHNAHATVHLLTARLPESARRRMAAAGSALAAVFFAALCAGAVWLTIEYWHSFEQTEVLHIPFRPIRVLIALSAFVLTLACARRARRQEERS